MQIWYELDQAGEAGMTFNELLEKVTPRVPLGYAWRRYNRRRANTSGIAKASTIPLADTPANRKRSVRYIVRNMTDNMRRDRTILKRPDGRFAALRKPRSAFTDDQHDFDNSLSRKQVSIMELLRQCRALRAKVEADRTREHPPQHLPAVSKGLYAAIEKFVDAHAPT